MIPCGITVLPVVLQFGKCVTLQIECVYRLEVCVYRLEVCVHRLEVCVYRLEVCVYRLEACVHRLEVCFYRLEVCVHRLEACKFKISADPYILIVRWNYVYANIFLSPLISVRLNVKWCSHAEWFFICSVTRKVVSELICL